MPIHPTAVIYRGAEIDATAEIGPFCIVGSRVKIGPRTHLISHVVLANHTTVGADNVIHPFASVGGLPQDLKYRGEPGRLLIGNNNIIRENVTLNIGTENGAMQTTVGNGCLLMAYAHVAHDCTLDDGVILANGVALAGHVHLHHKAIVGGVAAIHQFCRIGRLAFVGGGAMVAQDIPPFCIAQGDRATLAGLNTVGLRRAGWPRARIQAVRTAFTDLFSGQMPRATALKEVEQGLAKEIPEVAELCTFVRTSERGVPSARRNGSAADA